MNVMVYGTKKCRETQKAQRWLKERNIPFQSRDIEEKAPTSGELANLARGASLRELVDEASPAFAKLNLGYMEWDAEEELLAHPAIMKTPVIRIDGKAFIRPDLAKLPLGG